MTNNAFEQPHQEELHRLYYNLAHHVLPRIILSENADALLGANPAGEGVLSMASIKQEINSSQDPKAGLNHTTKQAPSDASPEARLTEQNQERAEDEALDSESAPPPLDGKAIHPGKTGEFTFIDDDADVSFADDADDLEKHVNPLESDSLDEYVALPDNDSEEAYAEELDPEDMAQFMAELEKMLELNNEKSNSDNPDENFLEDTWREAWFNTSLVIFPENTGYTLQRINREGYEIVLFTFPEPFQIPDAWMAAAIRKPGGFYRYYTLEYTVSKEEDTAVLAEWETGNIHRNTAKRTTDVRNTEAFLDMVIKDLID